MQATPSTEKTHTPALPDRVAALELLVQHLVFALDAEGALPAEPFAAWLGVATQRMRDTHSVATATVNALDQLRTQVLQ